MNTLAFNIPHRKLYIYFLMFLVFGVSLSKPLMSISIIALALNWIFEGNFIEKIKKNKSYGYAPIILSAAFFIEVIWMLKTEVLSEGIFELKTKLPMLFLPLIIGTSKALEKPDVKKIIYSFYAGLFISSIMVFAADLNLIPTKNNSGTFRDNSIFMSHIRYSALVSFGVLLLVHLRNKIKHKVYAVIMILWFLYILYILQSLTGILCLCLSGFLYLSIKIYCEGIKKRIKTVLALGLPILGIVLYTLNIYYDYTIIKDNNSLSALTPTTKLGEKYIHDLNNLEIENGNYLWINIAPKEAEKTWNEISKVKFNDNDLRGQPIKYTLYRYLTSKGLKKDREGVMSLTPSDIKRIESGHTTHMNYNLFEKRVRGVYFELTNYKNGQKSNNHSLTQRITFLEIASQILKEDFYLGKGTGGTKSAYRKYYLKEQKGLSHQNQLRAHNQFITQFINLGLIGFLLWIVSILYPVLIFKPKHNALYYSFLLIIFISFLADDMLERQAGVTIFTAFNALLLFGITNKNYSLSS
ncbi:MAG: O-antigen ligase family protein [Flavobacteriales bacterium]|nr:O-antigen ligase family protein [Flavobacteriales bacterium]